MNQFHKTAVYCIIINIFLKIIMEHVIKWFWVWYFPDTTQFFTYGVQFIILVGVPCPFLICLEVVHQTYMCRSVCLSSQDMCRWCHSRIYTELLCSVEHILPVIVFKVPPRHHCHFGNQVFEKEEQEIVFWLEVSEYKFKMSIYLWEVFIYLCLNTVYLFLCEIIASW